LREQGAGLRHRLAQHRCRFPLEIRALGEVRRYAFDETCVRLLHAARILTRRLGTTVAVR